jgi:hypothetical protein
VAASLAACGEPSSDANEPAGTYRVAVDSASFPPLQRLGQTSLLKLRFTNQGKKTVPALAVSFGIAGKAGEDSSLPFGVHDETAGVAQSDRPVWVLASGYPQEEGKDERGGSTTSNPKTFDFGPLKPGESRAEVWKLSAVRQGKFTLRYSVDAGLSGTAKAETKGGVAPGGTFVAEVSAETPETEVTDSGEIVEIPQEGKKKSGK